MKKITIKYAVTGEFGRDAMMGAKWLRERCSELFTYHNGMIKLDLIPSRWKTVATKYITKTISRQTLMNQLWHEFNHISTEDLKNHEGSDAEFTQDHDDDVVERIMKLNDFDDKHPEHRDKSAHDKRYYFTGIMGWIAHTSMSVGDMIIIEDEKTIRYYIVDCVGFTNVRVIPKDTTPSSKISRREALELVDLVEKYHQTNNCSTTLLKLAKRLRVEQYYNSAVHKELV